MPNYTVSQDIDDFMKSTDDAAARTELGLGSAATSNTGDFATSVQGGKADSALQPSDIGSTVQAQDSVLDNTTASFTTAQESKLTAITGTNTGDQDLSGLQPILTEGAFVDGDKTKLDGVTGTNTGDQDLSGLQPILTEGAFADGDKTKLDGITGTNTGDQDLSGLQSILTEGAFVDGDKTKLDAITGTNTGDQDLSGLQSILTEGAFVDGDKTKLDGITGTNTGDQDLSGLQTILAEGAFVDGDKTKLDGIIISSFGASLIDDADASTARATLGVKSDSGIAVSDELTDLAGDDATALATFHAQRDGYFEEVLIGVTTAPVDSLLIADLHLNGTSIFTTKPSIDSGAKTSTTATTAAVILTHTYTKGDLIELFCDQVGSTTAGTGLKFYFNQYLTS